MAEQSEGNSCSFPMPSRINRRILREAIREEVEIERRRCHALMLQPIMI
jgi:hypothetical protein